MLMGLCILFLNGCNEADRMTAMNSNELLIKKTGTYILQPQQHTIQVGIDSNKILRYSVINKSGVNIIKSIEQPSAFHKWCLFWDHHENLWMESSDIGGFIWKKDSDGTYKQHTITDDIESYRLMPREIFDCLPTVIKKKWETKRNEP
jgi:hypothetical protein